MAPAHVELQPRRYPNPSRVDEEKELGLDLVLVFGPHIAGTIRTRSTFSDDHVGNNTLTSNSQDVQKRSADPVTGALLP